jgi:hypothetical protein
MGLSSLPPQEPNRAVFTKQVSASEDVALEKFVNDVEALLFSHDSGFGAQVLVKLVVIVLPNEHFPKGISSSVLCKVQLNRVPTISIPEVHVPSQSRPDNQQP